MSRSQPLPAMDFFQLGPMTRSKTLRKEADFSEPEKEKLAELRGALMFIVGRTLIRDAAQNADTGKVTSWLNSLVGRNHRTLVHFKELNTQLMVAMSDAGISTEQFKTMTLSLRSPLGVAASTVLACFEGKTALLTEVMRSSEQLKQLNKAYVHFSSLRPRSAAPVSTARKPAAKRGRGRTGASAKVKPAATKKRRAMQCQELKAVDDKTISVRSPKIAANGEPVVGKARFKKPSKVSKTVHPSALKRSPRVWQQHPLHKAEGVKEPLDTMVRFSQG